MIALAWSGGKDSALSLERLRADGRPPQLLMTTVDDQSGRATHHGISRSLLRQQAQAADLPLVEIAVPRDVSRAGYAARMRAAFSAQPLMSVTAVAFGDIYLEELRAHREARLAEAGRRALFPLWGSSTAALAEELVARDYEATLVSVDPCALSSEWLGRQFDSEFLDDLPPSVDPCGERGEFHTFVSACPSFGSRIGIHAGAVGEFTGIPCLELFAA